MKKEAFCKNPQCEKLHSKAEVARVNGKESAVYQGNFCSAQCYTQVFMSLQKEKTPDVVTSSQTFYMVTTDKHGSGHFSPDGYSKYNERFAKYHNGELMFGEEIYGYEQALDHAKELKEKVIVGSVGNSQPYANSEFRIIIETRTKTIIKI